MNRDASFSRFQELFEAARALPASARGVYLTRECDGDDALRRRVEEALAAGDHGDDASTAFFDPINETVGTVIGPYKLLQRIGEGGFGAVFLAEQEVPVRRRVALKIIKPGMDSKQVIARFEAERQALALMDHPSIARVLDAGTTASGRPYFAMELVRGEPITTFCDDRRLSISARLELFSQVCQAVHHAHTKGVIHRDIKPGNVLVTVVDGDTPLAKVIDFGIAKATSTPLTEQTLATGFRQLIGTLEYMSPEQADLSAMDIDTRSDVYALGVLLYELLTGVTPIDGKRLRSATFDELRRLIKEEEPPRPSLRVCQEPEEHQSPPEEGVVSRPRSTTEVFHARRSDTDTLPRTLRHDLDWIVMKCLEKDRTRRYDSAAALAQDVRRHLDGEAVVAVPPTVLYRMRKLARRHKVAVTIAGTIAMAVVIGVAGLAIGLKRAKHQERQAKLALERERETRDQLDWQQYANQLALAQIAIEKGAYPEARKQLELCLPQLRGWEWEFLRKKAATIHATLPENRGLRVHSGDGERLLTWSPDLSWCQLWDLDGNPVGKAMPQPGIWYPWGVCGAGGLLLTGYNTGEEAQLWDTSGNPIGQPLKHPGMLGAKFSPDGSRILTYSGKGYARLWNRSAEEIGGPLEHADLESARFSQDGQSVITRSRESERSWSLNGEPLGAAQRRWRRNGIASLDGSTVVTISNGTARLRSPRDNAGKVLQQNCTSAQFSPSSSVLVTRSAFPPELRVWTRDGEPLGEPIPCPRLRAFWFSPDDSTLLTESGWAVSGGMHDGGGFWQLWSLDGQRRGHRIPIWQPTANSTYVEFDPRGSRVLLIETDSSDGLLRAQLWHHNGSPLGTMMESADADWAVISETGAIELWPNPDSRTGPTQIVASPCWPVKTLRPSEALELELAQLGLPADFFREPEIERADESVVTAPNGSRRVIAQRRELRFVDAATGQAAITFRLSALIQAIAFSADGARLVIALSNGRLEIWDTRSAAEQLSEVQEEAALYEPACSWIDALFGNGVRHDQLCRHILEDRSRPSQLRAVAYNVAAQRERAVEADADYWLTVLKYDLVTPERLRQALLKGDGGENRRIEPAVRTLMLEFVAEWDPSAWELQSNARRWAREPDTPREQLEAAVDGAQLAVKKAPENADSWITLGIAQCRIDQYEAAITSLRRGIEQNGWKIHGLPFVTIAQAKLGRVDAAEESLSQLEEVASKVDVDLLHDATPFIREAREAVMKARHGERP